MDLLAHSLYVSAGAKKINDNLKNKKQNRISIIWSIFWGIFPDLFAFTLPFIISFWMVFSGRDVFASFSTRHQVANGFILSHTLYQYSHSLIIFLLIFFLIWLIRKKPWLPLLGWGIHIILDIPSHAIDFFPTPFLFPISKWVFPYGIRWSDPWFMVVNYSILLIIWGSILINRYRKKKLPENKNLSPV